MPRPARLLILPFSAASSVVLLGGGIASADLTDERILGLDVSAWQGNISQTTWNNIRNVENRQFVIIRSSRGGTTGEYHPGGGYPSNDNDEFWGSQRYDDPYFVQNVNRATAAGMFVGSYHFSRPDIIASTPNSNPPGGTAGVANTGTDEADHFIQMAGPFMRPGYLLPVHDFEAGDGVRTDEQMAQYCLDFSNRIYQVMGIRPAIYTSGNYAHNILGGASLSLRNQLAQPSATPPSVVSPAYPTLWSARWPNQTNPDAIDVQNAHPKDSFANIYGPWDDYGTTHPWVFWQYASTGRLQSFNNGGSNLDFDVTQGDIEFLKNQLVPAVWMNDNSGDWSTLTNWNSGQPVIVPPQMDGQLTPIGTQTFPTPRLPGAAGTGPTAGSNDTVILERPNANITVTLSTGTHNVRKLYMRETLNITGGSLNINYDPTYRADNLPNVLHAGPISAEFSGPVNVSGGALTAHTVLVSAGGTLSMSGGSVTFERALVNGGGLNFAGAGTLNVGTLELSSNPTFTGAAGTGQILAKAGFANPALNLMGQTRTFDVGQGSAATDLRVALPLTNGNLTKIGNGTLELSGDNSAFAGNITVNAGHLLLKAANNLGAAGVTTGAGGSVRIDGNGVNVTRNITLNGLGAGGGTGGGALENFTGSNTWSGNVLLAGTQHNQGQAGLNQIGAATDTTLTISGVIQDNTGGVQRSWAKVGTGDVVLTSADPNNPVPNTYTNLTRTFAGRLILEKDRALGAPGDPGGAATGNTFMLPGVNSAIAFRAPAGKTGFNYDAGEWIFTEGGGVGLNGVAGAPPVQIDNLGGNNTFNGSLGLGGPVVNGTQQAYLGVSSGSLEIKGGLHARTQVGPEARSIFKRGAGTLILSGGNATAPTTGSARGLVNSTFTIESGGVELRGAGANHPGIATWNVSGGGSLALNSSGVDSIITGAIAGPGALSKTGAGTMTLAGAVNGYAGALSITQGTLAVAASGADSSVAIANGININTGGGAKLDLFDNDLIVRTTPAATVESLVASGYAAGAWNGNGIMSTAAQTGLGLYTLGVASNAALELTSFDGHSGLTAADTFVKFTLVGDADLSGVVNGLDFLRFKAGFEGTQGDVWTFGDFDYSGAVDADDFALYFQGFLHQPGGTIPSGELFNDMTTFALTYGLDTSLIPEPGSLSLLALGAGLLLRRRRHAHLI